MQTATAPRLPTRMSPLQMQAITRACNVGADPKEIAADHGITVHAVLAITRRCNIQRQTARAVAGTKPRQIVRKAPPITSPEPNRQEGEYYVIRKDGMAIRLPMVSILRGEG